LKTFEVWSALYIDKKKKLQMVSGIGLGIGITLGVIIAVIFIGITVFIIYALYKHSLRRNFSVELFKHYNKELLRLEKFEELNNVNQIIEQLQKKEKPKEMLSNYKVDVDSYIYWASTYDGGERLTFRHDKRIIKKYKKNKKRAKKG